MKKRKTSGATSTISERQQPWLSRIQEQDKKAILQKGIDEEWRLLDNEWSQLETVKANRLYKTMTDIIMASLFVLIICIAIAIVLKTNLN